MPVSFRGLSKGSALGKCKVFWGNTTRRCGDFFKNPKGLTLSFDETLLTFAHRTKQLLCFFGKNGKNKNESVGYNRKQETKKRIISFAETIPFQILEI